MKKFSIILSSGILIAVLILTYFINQGSLITIEQPIASAPNKPKTVPNEAFWVGGTDGGNFFHMEIHPENDKKLYTQIFNDFTGDLEFEGVLNYSGDLSTQELISMPSLYQGWDGDNIHLSNGDVMPTKSVGNNL